TVRPPELVRCPLAPLAERERMCPLAPLAGRGPGARRGSTPHTGLLHALIFLVATLLIATFSVPALAASDANGPALAAAGADTDALAQLAAKGERTAIVKLLELARNG